MYECKACQKKSKNGTEYFCLEVTFPCGYRKTVFLDSAEQHIVMTDILNFGERI